MNFRALVYNWVKRILKTRIVSPLTYRYILSHIRKISQAKNPQLGILILFQERFWPGDLERLSEKAQLWSMPYKIQAFISALFFSSEEMSLLRTYNVDANFQSKEKLFIEWFKAFILMAGEKMGFDCILTSNYMYVQNRLIAKACKGHKIPFFEISRESKQDERLNSRFIKKYKEQQVDVSFNGDAIFVYSGNMKKLLCGIDAAPEHRIHVVGALRTDRLIQRLRSHLQPNSAHKQVTLFSFRHAPIGSNEMQYAKSGFCPDRKKGFIELFDSVHGAFAELAQNNLNVEFVIKTKYGGYWIELIEEAILKRDIDVKRLNNLTILSQEADAIEEILKSCLVIGLNSMTMVQARLANRLVVEPYYFEIRDKYKEALQYKDVQDEFLVAASERDFKNTVQKYIECPEYIEPERGIFDQYIGPTDGKNLDRLLTMMELYLPNGKRKDNNKLSHRI